MMSLATLVLLITGVGMALAVKVSYVGVGEISSYNMHIFICNAEGPFLQWEINYVNITPFEREDLRENGNIRSGMTKGCYYNTMLVSSQPFNEHLNSMLFVYCANDSEIEVTCRNHSDSDGFCARERSGIQSLPRATNHTGAVSLDYLFSSREVIPWLNISISVFSCTVTQEFMAWKVNNKSPYGFGSEDKIGTSIIFLSRDNSFVTEQSVIYDRGPSKIVTFLFVTRSENVNVTCESTSNYSASLTTAIVEESPTSGDDATTSISGDNNATGTVVSVTTDSPVKRTSNYTLGVGAIIGITLSVAVLCVFFVHVSSAGMGLYCCRLGSPFFKNWKKKNQDQQSHLPMFHKNVKDKVDRPVLSKSNDAAITSSEKNLDRIRAYSA